MGSGSGCGGGVEFEWKREGGWGDGGVVEGGKVMMHRVVWLVVAPFGSIGGGLGSIACNPGL